MTELTLDNKTVYNSHYFMRNVLAIIKLLNREASSSSVVREDFRESLRMTGFELNGSSGCIETDGKIFNGGRRGLKRN